VRGDEPTEVFKGEPGDPPPGFHREAAEGFKEERFPGAVGARRPPGFSSLHPLQGAQRPLGGGGGGEGLPVGNQAALRRAASMDRPRPATSSTSRALTTSTGSRCGFAVASSSGARLAHTAFQQLHFHRSPAGLNVDPLTLSTILTLDANDAWRHELPIPHQRDVLVKVCGLILCSPGVECVQLTGVELMAWTLAVRFDIRLASAP
jgi:hypothetical protein